MNSVVLMALLLPIVLIVQTANAINGGTPAAVGQHPSQVVLVLPAGKICGGTIVNAHHIVTSARCVLDDNNHLMAGHQVSLRAGITTLIVNSPATVTVSAIFPHPHYSPFTQEHDIAVLRTQQHFTFEPNNFTAPVAPADLYVRIIPDNTLCIVAGFNIPTPISPSPTLQVISVPVRPRDACNAAAIHAGTIRESMICAGNEAADNSAAICESTRGAGLFCQNRYVGVASFGFACGSGNVPGAYTQIRYHSDWIQLQFNRTQIPQPGPTPHPGTDSSTAIIPVMVLIGASALFALLK